MPKLKIFSGTQTPSGASNCNGIYDSINGVCSGRFFADIIFPETFNEIPHIIVSPDNVSLGGGCAGGATDKVGARAINIGKNGFRLLCFGSPDSANCGSTKEGWSTVATCSWLAIGY